jgi:hypothetical protein
MPCHTPRAAKLSLGSTEATQTHLWGDSLTHTPVSGSLVHLIAALPHKGACPMSAGSSERAGGLLLNYAMLKLARSS